MRRKGRFLSNQQYRNRASLILALKQVIKGLDPDDPEHHKILRVIADWVLDVERRRE